MLASLKEDLVNSQKGLTYDIQLDYIFIDGYGNATSDDEQIRGIEYRVQYLDDEGKVRGTAERHLVINQMK